MKVKALKAHYYDGLYVHEGAEYECDFYKVEQFERNGLVTKLEQPPKPKPKLKVKRNESKSKK